MPSTERRVHFDRWSRMDDGVAAADAYPFASHDRVLERITESRKPVPGQRIPDVAIGTGDSAVRLVASDLALWSIDFSGEMLARWRSKIPKAHLVQASHPAGLPRDLPDRLDRIVSGYVFCEFPDREKLRLIEQLVPHLAPDALILVGDIAFKTEEALEECREDWKDSWDDTEHYWVAKRLLPCLEARGLVADYEQFSFCIGVSSARGAVA